MPKSKPTVGFIGVGNMGWPMAACLVKAGFPDADQRLAARGREQFRAAERRHRAGHAEATRRRVGRRRDHAADQRDRRARAGRRRRQRVRRHEAGHHRDRNEFRRALGHATSGRAGRGAWRAHDRWSGLRRRAAGEDRRTGDHGGRRGGDHRARDAGAVGDGHRAADRRRSVPARR